MANKLVIVESPAKAKTIAGYLGKDFVVEASVGHIRDIPTPSEMPAEMKKGPFGRFGINIEEGFEPYYVVDPGKKKKVTELKRLLKDADTLYLATDEDREGEAIAWHLLETLKPKVPVKRMVFHEITQEAIQRAVEETRDLDIDLVNAQESRRILDRLYGYEVSPVLWRKVQAKLSAGRVQSVATRIVVERERERMAFKVASYWSVEGRFSSGSAPFAARLASLDGTKVATGSDFDDTGALKGSARQLDERAATAVAEATIAADATVTSVSEKPYTRRPYAPFTTSTLQQEAGRKLGLGSKAAMGVAQKLYENGYITYMRTDSTNLSGAAVSAARGQARDMYGADFVPESPRVYGKKAKNAQEAHEAIRPAGDRFRTPAQVAGELRGDEFKLYELIWKRTIASQMADAKGSTATIKLHADLGGCEVARAAEYSASGTVITFKGFLAAYEEGTDEPREPKKDGEARLPKLAEGSDVDVVDARASGHETSPPARYTEASLVKKMEELGIGRPSTYASTISTIQDRGYVRRKGSALIPTWLAFAVTRLMEVHFSRLVDYRFTASMEEDLDLIASGSTERVAWLQRFYYGDDQGSEGLAALVSDLDDIDAKAISTIEIGDGVVVRVGRYGPYVEDLVPTGVDPKTGEVTGDAADAAAKPKRASISDDIAPDELTPAMAREFLAQASDDGRLLGQDPETGRDVIVKTGRYGPFVTEVLEEAEDKPKRGKAKVKPRTASLFKGMDPATVDLEQALRLLSLPRTVGTVTETTTDEDGTEKQVEVPITAQNGRYGPYMKKGTDSRSLETEEQIFSITLEEALAIYAQPKQRGRAAKPPLREFGEDPVSGKKVVVKDGRFGPYVTDGETNATLRRGDEPETVTAERAYELIAEKRAKGPSTRKKSAKKATKKTAKTAKKTATKKTATKKATTKKA
ncbi:MAG TPA: type I DNA topoisomerase [Candidatus Janibacter merdipullorum]|nr:type I DNA topoisomerase [Candidatus Janibacter merdipullorum]